MDKLKIDKCKISLYISPHQEDLSEERIHEGFKTVFLQKPVVGAKLMRAVREELRDKASDEDGIRYTIALTDLEHSGTHPRRWGNVYFTDSVRVPRYLYAENLMEVILKALGVEKSTCEIYGFDPLPKRGAQVSNELVNQIRDEMGF